jgi:hypothetical protein
VCLSSHFSNITRLTFCRKVWLLSPGMDLDLFKINPCPSTTNGVPCMSSDSCQFFHNPSERRRRLSDHPYGPQPCPHVFQQINGHEFWQDASNCPNGDACQSCHTLYELLFHPQKYKTSICPNAQYCKNPFCPFAHNPDELRSSTPSPASSQSSPAYMEGVESTAATSPPQQPSLFPPSACGAGAIAPARSRLPPQAVRPRPLPEPRGVRRHLVSNAFAVGIN